MSRLSSRATINANLAGGLIKLYLMIGFVILLINETLNSCIM